MRYFTLLLYILQDKVQRDANDHDDLMQSSDTAPEDYDLPPLNCKNVFILLEQLSADCKSKNVLKFSDRITVLNRNQRCLTHSKVEVSLISGRPWPKWKELCWLQTSKFLSHLLFVSVQKELLSTYCVGSIQSLDKFFHWVCNLIGDITYIDNSNIKIYISVGGIQSYYYMRFSVERTLTIKNK